MAREFAKSFYNSVAWKQAREMALLRDGYLCRVCGAPAIEVHHIVHLSHGNIQDPTITLSQENLISLCHDCHTAAHHDALTDEGFKFDENGQLVKL